MAEPENESTKDEVVFLPGQTVKATETIYNFNVISGEALDTIDEDTDLTIVKVDIGNIIILEGWEQNISIPWSERSKLELEEPDTFASPEQDDDDGEQDDDDGEELNLNQQKAIVDFQGKWTCEVKGVFGDELRIAGDDMPIYKDDTRIGCMMDISVDEEGHVVGDFRIFGSDHEGTFRLKLAKEEGVPAFRCIFTTNAVFENGRNRLLWRGWKSTHGQPNPENVPEFFSNLDAESKAEIQSIADNYTEANDELAVMLLSVLPDDTDEFQVAQLMNYLFDDKSTNVEEENEEEEELETEEPQFYTNMTRDQKDKVSIKLKEMLVDNTLRGPICHTMQNQFKEYNVKVSDDDVDKLCRHFKYLLKKVALEGVMINCENYVDFLSCYGFFTRAVDDKGSCWYESFCLLLRGSQDKNHILEIRNRVADYILNSVPKEERDNFGLTNDIIRRMRDPKEWSGEVDIQMTARAYNVNIICYYKSDGVLREYFRTKPIPHAPVYHVWHHNNEVKLSEHNLQHYSPLFRIHEETILPENEWLTVEIDPIVDQCEIQYHKHGGIIKKMNLISQNMSIGNGIPRHSRVKLVNDGIYDIKTFNACMKKNRRFVCHLHTDRKCITFEYHGTVRTFYDDYFDNHSYHTIKNPGFLDSVFPDLQGHMDKIEFETVCGLTTKIRIENKAQYDFAVENYLILHITMQKINMIDQQIMEVKKLKYVDPELRAKSRKERDRLIGFYEYYMMGSWNPTLTNKVLEFLFGDMIPRENPHFAALIEQTIGKFMLDGNAMILRDLAILKEQIEELHLKCLNAHELDIVQKHLAFLKVGAAENIEYPEVTEEDLRKSDYVKHILKKLTRKIEPDPWEAFFKRYIPGYQYWSIGRQQQESNNFIDFYGKYITFVEHMNDVEKINCYKMFIRECGAYIPGFFDLPETERRSAIAIKFTVQQNIGMKAAPQTARTPVYWDCVKCDTFISGGSVCTNTTCQAWRCDVCSLVNDSFMSRCETCRTAKPGNRATVRRTPERNAHAENRPHYNYRNNTNVVRRQQQTVVYDEEYALDEIVYYSVPVSNIIKRVKITEMKKHPTENGNNLKLLFIDEDRPRYPIVYFYSDRIMKELPFGLNVGDAFDPEHPLSLEKCNELFGPGLYKGVKKIIEVSGSTHRNLTLGDTCEIGKMKLGTNRILGNILGTESWVVLATVRGTSMSHCMERIADLAESSLEQYDYTN